MQFRHIFFILLASYLSLQTKAQRSVYKKHYCSDSTIRRIQSVLNKDHVPRSSLGKYFPDIAKIDSTCYDVYLFISHFALKNQEYKTAIVAINKMIQLDPLMTDNYVDAGIVSELIGDSMNGQNYFRHAELLYNKYDTVKDGKLHDQFLLEKACNLIFIGENKKANKILKKLNRHSDEMKTKTEAYIQKTRSEVLHYFIKQHWEM
jgi:tetratricopeptide (TPR) repeat protein